MENLKISDLRYLNSCTIIYIYIHVNTYIYICINHTRQLEGKAHFHHIKPPFSHGLPRVFQWFDILPSGFPTDLAMMMKSQVSDKAVITT